MGMFDNYNNQNTDYIPNNLGYAGKRPMAYPIPYAEYNAEGEQSGYYWYYGDTVNLVFDIVGELTVTTGTRIYVATGQTPNENTEGQIGDKAYNITDKIAWTLSTITGSVYNWTQDSEYTEPEEGDIPAYVSADNYIAEMTAQIKIFNFRFEEVYSEEFQAADEITLSIGRELSEKLVKGTYYITFTLIDKTTNVWNYIPIFRDKECVITVK